MKKLKLPEHIITKLVDLPETGMGYHNVNLTLKNGVTLTERQVMNSEFVLLHDTENYNTDDFEGVELDK